MKRSIVFLAIALAGCASATEWAKPGTDRAAADLAYRQCRAAAAQAVGTDLAIDKDILATRGGDWQRAQTLPVETGRMRDSADAHGESVIAACMQAKGFSRTTAGAPPIAVWRLP